MYLDENGQYLVRDGNLIDLKAERNLTQKRMDELLAINSGTLPLDLAIKQVAGSGKRVVAVFEDPNCG